MIPIDWTLMDDPYEAEAYAYEVVPHTVPDEDGFPCILSLPRISWAYLDWLLTQRGYHLPDLFRDARWMWPFLDISTAMMNNIHTIYVHRTLRDAIQPDWCENYDYEDLDMEAFRCWAAEPLPDEAGKDITLKVTIGQDMPWFSSRTSAA